MSDITTKKCAIERVGASGYNYLFYSDSLYCDSSLRLQNFESFILSILHKYRYNTIIFFDHNDGIHCEDEASWINLVKILENEFLSRRKKKPKNTHNNIRASIRRGQSKPQVITAEDEEELSIEEQVEFIKNIRPQSVHDQIKWVNLLLKAKDPFSVAIVANQDLLSSHCASNGLLDDLFNNAIEEWSTNHCTLALFIWCFCNKNAQDGYYDVVRKSEDNSFLSLRSKILDDFQALGQHASEDNPRPKTIVEIPLPTKSELRNYLNRIRILGEVKYDILELDAIAECLFHISKEKHLRLSDVHIKLLELKNQSSNISCETIRKLFGVKELKTGEQQLSELIGMGEIKNLIKRIKRQYSVKLPQNDGNISRLERATKEPRRIKDKLHFLLKGNPGTGKTTVAKILGRTLNEIGVLSSGHVVKCPSSYFTSKYYGETAQKTAQKVEEAMGGVLFIDDIASFIDTASSSIGEFNGVLLDAMTSYQDICIIIAGYPDAVDKYINKDQGLGRRFSEVIYLGDYSHNELTDIFELMAMKEGYTLSKELKDILPIVFKRMYERLSRSERANWGNAGVAELLFNEIQRSRADNTCDVLDVTDLPDVFKFSNIDFPINDYIHGVPNQKQIAVPTPSFSAVGKLNNLYNKYNDLEILEEAILSITASKKGSGGEGTGFIITPDGFAITAAHVVEDATEVKARVRMHLKYGGSCDEYYACTVVSINHYQDLALIKLEHFADDSSKPISRKFPYIKINSLSSDIYKSLTVVTMIGYPGGVSSNDNASTFQGRIASMQNNEDFGEIYLLDIKGISGNSGSPIINADGEAIGVFLASKTYRGETLTEEINYMRPIKYIKKLFKR